MASRLPILAAEGLLRVMHQGRAEYLPHPIGRAPIVLPRPCHHLTLSACFERQRYEYLYLGRDYQNDQVLILRHWPEF